MSYQVDTYSHLSKELLTEWESVWSQSAFGHIFNSPYWYQACLFAEPKPIMIITCRDRDQKLVGLLPLIQTKKFGFTLYASPGRKYLDKSTLLLTDGSSQVFTSLLSRLTKIGNYYLTEVNEKLTTAISQVDNNIGVSQCSDGRDLVVGDDPLRNLSKENRRRLLKRLRDDNSLTCDNGSDNINENIALARKIEQESTKAKDHKEIFSDPYLLKICQKIDDLSPGIINFTFLYQNNEPICYKYGFMTHSIYHYSNTAYKLSHQKLSPGRLLMITTFQLLQKKGVQFVDFSRGDTAFKREFSTSLYRQYTLYHQNNPLNMLIWRILYRIKKTINL